MSVNKRAVTVFGFIDVDRVAGGSRDPVDTAFADFCTTASTREELKAIVEKSQTGERFFLVYRGDNGSYFGSVHFLVGDLE